MRQELRSLRSSIRDVSAVLDFADGLLKDPRAFWEKLPAPNRPAFQYAVYPSGLSFDGSLFGTDVTSLAFRALRPSEISEEEMVTPAGFEPALPG